MNNPTVSNPDDFKVVEFHNSEDFTFAPEMGCMFDGRPISGITGAPGINGGESITLPFHIAHRLAENLAKYVMTRRGPENVQLDSEGKPMVAAIWDTARLEKMKNSYLKELYTEEKPIQQSETDRLFERMEALQKLVEEKVGSDDVPVVNVVTGPTVPKTYVDKVEVIAELERLNIVHDKRQSKVTLEELLSKA